MDFSGIGIDDEFSPRSFQLDDLDGAIIEDQPTSRSLLKRISKVPTITCQVILDQLTEHSVLNLLTGDLDLGN